MYYRIAVYSHPARWQERFGLGPVAGADALPYRRYNIGPVDQRHPERWRDAHVPLIQAHGGHLVTVDAVWGPVMKRGERWRRFCKARLEQVLRSPIWRRYWQGGRRGIVPADGYYLWPTSHGRRSGVPPYLVRRRDGEPMALAALYGTAPAVPAGKPLPFCVLVSRHACGELAKIHYRMPAELPESQWEAWLTGGGDFDPAALAATDPTGAWEWWRVSPAVNDLQAEGPELIERA